VDLAYRLRALATFSKSFSDAIGKMSVEDFRNDELCKKAVDLRQQVMDFTALMNAAHHWAVSEAKELTSNEEIRHRRERELAEIRTNGAERLGEDLGGDYRPESSDHDLGAPGESLDRG